MAISGITLVAAFKSKIKLRFAVVEQHGDRFLQIGMQLMQRPALAVRAGKAGHMAT